MCTVAVLAGSGGGYIVAHNRDERRTRSRGTPPGEAGSRLLCPRDPDGGGTWVAVTPAGLTLCMLNAPDPPPERMPESPQSRGTVPLKLSTARTGAEVRSRMAALPMDRYRPFHLVATLPGEAAPGILEYRWDGKAGVWASFTAPALFVSSSLHQIPADRARAAAWERFLEHSPFPDRTALARFMESHEPEKSSLSTCMHREDALTVSRTVIEVGPERIEMAYTDGSPCQSGSPTSIYEMSRAD